MFLSVLKKKRLLLYRLVWSDFKTKYAGTALGVFWAVFQPIVTVLVYVFVFSIGFRSAPVQDVPYVLWLISALVPWLFFSEVLSGASTCVHEYSYLVKKTIFSSELLPFVKAGSAVIAHIAFCVLAFAVFLISGIGLTVYVVQIAYYSFCTLIFGLALGILCAALAPFFRDITQIVAIVLQIGFWVTPIAWDLRIMDPQVQQLLQLNPMFYCVQGFRDSLLSGVWFFQRPILMIYFWVFTGIIFLAATRLYHRLCPYFADVL